MQQEIESAMQHLSDNNQVKLLRLAQHLSQHKLLSRLYVGQEDPEPCCLCTNMN